MRTGYAIRDRRGHAWLKVVRTTSRHPMTIHILDPHWKEVG